MTWHEFCMKNFKKIQLFLSTFVPGVLLNGRIVKQTSIFTSRFDWLSLEVWKFCGLKSVKPSETSSNRLHFEKRPAEGFSGTDRHEKSTGNAGHEIPIRQLWSEKQARRTHFVSAEQAVLLSLLGSVSASRLRKSDWTSRLRQSELILHFRASREQLKIVWGLWTECPGQNPALTVLQVPSWLDSGWQAWKNLSQTRVV